MLFVCFKHPGSLEILRYFCEKARLTWGLSAGNFEEKVVLGGGQSILKFRSKRTGGMEDSYFDMFIPRINNRTDHIVI